MTFAWPQLLWILAGPAALIAWDLAAKHRAAATARPNILRAEAGLHDVSLVASARPSRGRRPWWLAAGLALAIIGLARPQWGRIEEPVFNQSREIVIAIDLSRSMLTPDVEPSRLERAKLLVQSLLGRLSGERVGLVVFSGTAFLQSPLTSDYEILREFLPALSPDFMPVGGTNYGAMIDTAASAFEGDTTADRFLIVLSDGGANDEGWQDHVAALKAKKIRVIGLGVGTDKGGFIPDMGGGFMKDDQGAVVLAKLESGTLQELAKMTGGAYRDAGRWVDLPALLKATVEAGRKGQFVEKHTVLYIERFQWALAPALFCLLMSLWLEFPVRPRPRDVVLKGLAAAPILAAGLALAFLASAPVRAETGDTGAAPDAGGLLGRMVARMSAQDHPSALDWAELGRQTVTWGQQLQSSHQEVPAGPIRDALSAVDRGSALDASATDWPRLRSDLEALLKPQAEQPKKKDQQQRQQPQQKQQQKPQENREQGQPQNQRQNQPQERQQNQQQANPQPQAQQKSAGGEQRAPESENKAEPQSSGGMQKVGGTTERKGRDPARAVPELAIPLEKLDQVRTQDSPARLYQMIEDKEPKPVTPANSKNW